MRPEILHDVENHRFYCVVEGKECKTEYEIVGQKMDIKYTYVPPELRGFGIATFMLEEVVKYIEKSGMKVIPTCSFAKKFFDQDKYSRYVA